MNQICKEILRRFARGETLTAICAAPTTLDGERGEYCFADVNEWLTAENREEVEYALFREKFVKIQKNRLPLMREEIRETALSLPHHIIEDKRTGKRSVQPEKWQYFKAQVASYRCLAQDIRLLDKMAITQAQFLKKHGATETDVLARPSTRANSTSEGAPAPSPLTPSLLTPPSSPLFPPVPEELLAKIGGTQSDWRALPRIDLSCKITPEKAEEFLGYPLPRHIFPANPKVLKRDEKPRQEDIIAFTPLKPVFEEDAENKYTIEDIIPELRPYARIENGSLKYITFDISTGQTYMVSHFTLPTGGWKNRSTGQFVFFNSE
jgi:hypothetical protein